MWTHSMPAFVKRLAASMWSNDERAGALILGSGADNRSTAWRGDQSNEEPTGDRRTASHSDSRANSWGDARLNEKVDDAGPKGSGVGCLSIPSRDDWANYGIVNARLRGRGPDIRATSRETNRAHDKPAHPKGLGADSHAAARRDDKSNERSASTRPSKSSGDNRLPVPADVRDDQVRCPRRHVPRQEPGGLTHATDSSSGGEARVRPQRGSRALEARRRRQESYGRSPTSSRSTSSEVLRSWCEEKPRKSRSRRLSRRTKTSMNPDSIRSTQKQVDRPAADEILLPLHKGAGHMAVDRADVDQLRFEIPWAKLYAAPDGRIVMEFSSADDVADGFGPSSWGECWPSSSRKLEQLVGV